MKALTLRQPWASLVMLGEKRFETRSWSYRLPWNEATGKPLPIQLAIHAAKGMNLDEREYAELLIRSGALFPCGDVSELSRGAILGTVTLLGCTYSYPETRAELFAALGMDEVAQIEEMDLGDWADGRVLWQLAGPQPFAEPVPARGALGLWDWTPPG